MSFWTAITSGIAIIKAFIDLWKYVRAYQSEREQLEAERRRQERDKAIDDAKRATTPEEAFDAQRRIVDNEP